ncbi:MAG: MopE-related protein, partial [Bacteroidota bacterium]
ATETCNGVDDDCDGSADEGVQTTFYIDADGDGFGSASGTTLACSVPAGYSSTSNDCNDANNAIYPGATETCNTVDDDCDGSTDEGVQTTYYVDADGDGYGSNSTTALGCTPPTGYVVSATDCDDSDNSLNPGATEVCDGIDQDCDGTADDGLTFINYYADGDGDGFGTGTANSLCADPGLGYSTLNTDCEDTNEAIYPGAPEVCNSIDDDCDGQVDEGLTYMNYYVDQDGDGYGSGATTLFCSNPGGNYTLAGGDCNELDNSVYPNAPELCNGIDDDCDTAVDEGALITYYFDGDNDGYGVSSNTLQACTPPTGYTALSGDCFDASPVINPAATESCNGLDDNCDGIIDNATVTYYSDADGDGFGSTNLITAVGCTPPTGYVSNSSDCNDTNSNAYPGATEVCNGADDDCDASIDEGVLNTYFADVDGDGFGSTTTISGCSAPTGYVSNSTDCDDSNISANPGATELCNNIDDDCDGTTDEGCPSTTPGEEPYNAISAPSSYYAYCSNFYGTLADAVTSTYAQSTCITGEDKWYTFTALSSGITIYIGTYFNDILIELQDANGNLVETENAVNGIGTEVLNYVGLTPGMGYRVGVRNFNSNLAAGNQFSGCIRHLKRGGCDSGSGGGGNWPGSIGMCSLFKASYAGSGVQYRFTWTGLTGIAAGNVYTRTQSSDYLNLTNVVPRLPSGCQYNVLVTNIFTIPNGAGVNEVLEISALSPCPITILADPPVQLRTSDQCANGPRFRSSVVASLPWVCGVNNWRWRFTEVNPATFQTTGLPIEVNRGAASNYINLGTVTALQWGKTYAVQTAPVFTYTGSNYQWGPVQYLCIIGQSGMILNDDSSNQGEEGRNDFGIANDFDIALYPNPTNGEELNVILSGVSEDDVASVRIMNTLGQMVYQGQWTSESIRQKQLNVMEWSNGMYVIEVRANGQTMTKRFMISQ